MSDCKHGYILISKNGELVYKCIYCGDERKELTKEEPVVKEPKKGARRSGTKS